ncbi:MAG: riboflavin synthase, partial [bacterium (Candidatus Ratteibacteria) CG23_combo_of_CG06-09_8_20_14_all_48_7]
MFTGIIENIGKVTTPAQGKGTLFIDVSLTDVKPGESIAVNGVCLTITRVTENKIWFDLSQETLTRTTLGRLKSGDVVNLEQALRLGDRIGGHLVTGHVDGKGRIVGIKKTAGTPMSNWGEGKEMVILFPAELKKYIIKKGSVAMEGVSLTVAEVFGNRVSVALVPYTLN